MTNLPKLIILDSEKLLRAKIYEKIMKSDCRICTVRDSFKKQAPKSEFLPGILFKYN